jgi:hypothetical protein
VVVLTIRCKAPLGASRATKVLSPSSSTRYLAAGKYMLACSLLVAHILPSLQVPQQRGSHAVPESWLPRSPKKPTASLVAFTP